MVNILKLCKVIMALNLNACLIIFVIMVLFYKPLGLVHHNKTGGWRENINTILSVGRALRFQANLPIYFWGECILGAAHLINRTPTPLLQNKTPFEILFNKLPTFDAIRTIGCLCFALIPCRN